MNRRAAVIAHPENSSLRLVLSADQHGLKLCGIHVKTIEAKKRASAQASNTPF